MLVNVLPCRSVSCANQLLNNSDGRPTVRRSSTLFMLRFGLGAALVGTAYGKSRIISRICLRLVRRTPRPVACRYLPRAEPHGISHGPPHLTGRRVWSYGQEKLKFFAGLSIEQDVHVLRFLAMIAKLIAVLTCAVWFPLSALAADAPDFTVKKIGEGVYAAISPDSSKAGSNAGFIVGSAGVLVVDTFIDVAPAK